MSQNIKTALVVGASRGLGLGLVEAYLAEGWRVVATRRGHAEALEAMATTASGRLVIETLDVTDSAAIAALPTPSGRDARCSLRLRRGIQRRDAKDQRGFGR